MSYQYRISATIERKTTDKRGQEWTRTTSVPTFLLPADVQGIISDDHACRIAADLLNPWKDAAVTVHCSAMRVHVNYWPSQEYCTDCAKEQCSEIGHTEPATLIEVEACPTCEAHTRNLDGIDYGGDPICQDAWHNGE